MSWQPKIERRLRWEKSHRSLIASVLGAAGERVLAEVEPCLVDSMPKGRHGVTGFDGDEVGIYFTLTGWRHPLTVLHEAGHAVVAMTWPEWALKEATDRQHEVLALMAPARCSRRCPDVWGQYMDEQQAQNGAALQEACEFMFSENGFRDRRTVFELMEAYVDASKRRSDDGGGPASGTRSEAPTEDPVRSDG